MIYTTHPLHKIPAGNNIFEYLKQNIQKDIFVIFLWSNEYLKSAACLNGMGAAWIVESDYINMYTPDFDFNNPQYHNRAVDVLKAIQLLGFIYKEAIGELLTQLCANAILNKSKNVSPNRKR